MKFRLFVTMLALTAHVSTPGASPRAVVMKLYKQIVARRPLGIPKGPDKASISPLLSKALTQSLDNAQACQEDYFRQHPEKDSKPAFPWLEVGLFSGTNEEALPSAAEVVGGAQPQSDGSYRVFVQLTYKESSQTYEARTPNPANILRWQVAAVVKSEHGRFVVDDILFLDEHSKKVKSRLSESFSGCDGPRWVGHK